MSMKSAIVSFVLGAVLASQSFAQVPVMPAPDHAALHAATVQEIAGVVLLHGLGGSYVSMSTLAYQLREKGLLVANPDMPWSAMGAHTAPVQVAEEIVEVELDRLRNKGAQKLFLIGFSKGGLFAAHMAGKTTLDGLVLIAPNGASNYRLQKEGVEQALTLVAEGKGNERAALPYYDPNYGRTYSMATEPATYLSWFDPNGAMNGDRIYQGLKPGVPILLVVPTNDLSNLLVMKKTLFAALPAHPANMLYEPESNHIGAVNASADEVVRWIDARLSSAPTMRSEPNIKPIISVR